MKHSLMQSAPGTHIVIDGERCLYFGGTSYLGLQCDLRVIDAACEALRRYGVHSATSRASIGTNPATLAAERNAAQFFGCEDAFYFVSGYLGNAIFTRELCGCVDAVFLDEASHYCVREAAQILGKPLHFFRHRDAGHLGELLAQHAAPPATPLVLTDGVFAISGSIAPIADYHAQLARYERAYLCVDDAHAAGVLGGAGRGSFEHAKLTSVNASLTEDGSPGTRLLASATLSKALGGFGGIIAGTQTFIDTIKQQSHLFNGASAPPTGAAAATAKALELVMAEPRHRATLAANTQRIRHGLRGLSLSVEDTPVPIIGLVIGDRTNMQRIHDALRQRGLYVPMSKRYAGVGPEGAIRIAIFATHTPAMIDELLDGFRAVL